MPSKKNKTTIRKTNTASRKSTGAAGSRALRQEAERIRKLLATNDTKNAAAKYAIAARVKNVVDGKKIYGDSAVLELGEILGLDSKLLYAWADVARAWPRGTFVKIMGRTNELGLHLTWSHMQVLGQVKEGRREKLLERALAKNLTVRELRALTTPSARAGSDAESEETKVLNVAETALALSEKAEAFVADLAGWRPGLAKFSDVRPTADEAKALESAHEKVIRMVEEGNATVKALEAILGSAQPPPVLLNVAG